MKKDYSITKHFGVNLAKLLSKKILLIYPEFDSKTYIANITKQYKELSYTERVTLHAKELRSVLPHTYTEAITILMSILSPENPNETGMFKEFYWIMPIGKFVELYGLDDFDVSMHALEEITKRSTGEYAIRPFIRIYPKKTLTVMHTWSKSKNFHVRRLASEGLRPKLPWATKLDTFIDDPEPVFAILQNLIEDDIKFVQKSVANHITDYLKVNKPAAVAFIHTNIGSANTNTQWILKHATRKILIDS